MNGSLVGIGLAIACLAGFQPSADEAPARPTMKAAGKPATASAVPTRREGRVIVSKPATALPAALLEAERRPRIDFELTEYAEPEAEPVLMPLDTPPVPSGQQPAPVSAPARPTKASPQAYAAPQSAPVVYEPAPVRVIARWVGPEVIVGQGYLTSDSYDQTYQSAYRYSGMGRASWGNAVPMPLQPAPWQPAQPSPLYFDGAGTPAGQSSGSNPTIYVDARSTMEHGPRFGIGGGLFRSGDTMRDNRGRGVRSGLFGRRGAVVSGTSYTAEGFSTFGPYATAGACGPYGCPIR